MTDVITINKASPPLAPQTTTPPAALVPGTPSFVQRLLSISVTLAQATGVNQPQSFSESGTDTVTLDGSRTSVRIKNSGSLNGSTATVEIYGLTPSLMAQLSTLGMVYNIVPRNSVKILAGDVNSGLSTAFTGIIFAAYADYNRPADVPFHMICNAGIGYSTAPAPASTFAGATNVGDIMSGFAKQLGLGFENNGVGVQLSNPYFAGNLWQQVKACARAANINADQVDGPAGPLLAIWPKGGNRNTPTPTLIAPPPDGQMISYPSFTQQGIMVENIFNAQISRGQLVQVRSSLPGLARANPNGQWAVTKIDHDLDSQVEKGQWKSTLFCYNPKYPLPTPPTS